MMLNPYNFRQYLTRPSVPLQLGAWVLFGLSCAFFTFFAIPYLAPAAVAIDLPRHSPVGLQAPPSAFVVYTGAGYIYQNKTYSTTTLIDTLRNLPQKGILLIATSAGTSLQELLPLLNKAEGMGFQQVAFTVRP